MTIRKSSPNSRRTVTKLVILSVMALVAAVIVACGGSAAGDPTPTQASSSISGIPTSTPLPGRREALTEGGTPIHKAGTPNVTPLPNQIGDCILEPGTNCEGADLRGVDLSPARASAWSFGVNVELKNANFSGADLTGSNLTAADLEGVNFTDANLTGVDFKDASLYKANLTRANLTDAKFTFSDLDDAIFDGAIFCRTRMPNGSDNNDNC